MIPGLGPPEKERPGDHHDARPDQKVADGTTNRANRTAPTRRCGGNAPVGRRACVFREGFRRGALDALRVAQREINDPAVWVTLSRLADRYDRDPDDLPGVDQ
jgi:hypothetical protein